MIKVGDRKKNNCTTQICKSPLNKGIKPTDQHLSHSILCIKSAKSRKELKVRSDSIQGNTEETRHQIVFQPQGRQQTSLLHIAEIERPK